MIMTGFWTIRSMASEGGTVVLAAMGMISVRRGQVARELI
jgi:hypothetical protein